MLFSLKKTSRIDMTTKAKLNDINGLQNEWLIKAKIWKIEVIHGYPN